MSFAFPRPAGATLLGCAANRALSALVSALALATSAAAAPFYMGADISLATFMEEEGVVFTDNGVAKPLEKVLYDHGANLFRIRIFVDPETVYDNGNVGAIQTLEYDLALAQQIKANAPGAKILLDFHYSDTWADPGNQDKPAAWESLNLAELQSTIRTYTQDTLVAFRDAGVMPEMVQVGNEIKAGMLFDTGRINFNGTTAERRASWQTFGSLLNSAIQGVRLAEGDGPRIDVAIHIDKGDQNGHPQFFFGNLTNPTWGNVTDFDIIGVSYYPSSQSGHSLAFLESNLNSVANTFPGKKIMILETNYAWKSQPNIGVPQWEETPVGQQQFLSDLMNVMLNLDNDAGAGIVWWYPEAVQIPGYFIYNNGSTALFDSSRNALPAVSLFEITLTPGDFNRDGYVDAADYTVWRNNYGDTNEMDIAYSGDGVPGVDEGDYAVWRQNYGATPNAGSGGGGLVNSRDGQYAVPEPSSAWLLLAGVAILRRRAARAQAPDRLAILSASRATRPMRAGHAYLNFPMREIKSTVRQL